MAQASWLCLPASATPRAAVCLPSFLPFFFLLLFDGKIKRFQQSLLQEQMIPSTFYHFLLSSAICRRVVRKIPIPEGSGSMEKSISITHFQPEFHTLEALDVSLGGLVRNSFRKATPPGIQHLQTRGGACREMGRLVKSRLGAGAGSW